MEPTLWIALAACAASCFFAACNIALKTYGRARLGDLFEAAHRPARLDFIIAHTPKLQLMTALSRTTANFIVLLAMLYLVEQRLPGHHRIVQYVAALALAAVLVSVLGVAIPTAWARYHPERIIVWSYWPLRQGLWLFRPVADFLHLFDPLIRRMTGVSVDPDAPPQMHQELMSAVEQQVDQGAVDAAQQRMLQAVLELPSTTAGEVMTPRTDIQGLPAGATLEEAQATIYREGHSRIPVYEDTIDHVVGILYAKDLIRLIGSDQPFDLRALVREALMVPESKPVRELLAEFKVRKVHLAIVIDEYGGTAGLVTIEDIIEELVGDISDEYEPGQPRPAVRRIDARTFEVDARARVDQLNRELELALPESADYDTVAGFVLATLGRIPAAGESVTHGNVRLTVLDAQRHKVNRLRLERIEAAASLAPALPLG